MRKGLTTALSLALSTTLAVADDYFVHESVSSQSNYAAYPVGFWSDANGTYAASFEEGAFSRSRWIQTALSSPAGNLLTAETTPHTEPVKVLGANSSGLCCGWAKKQDGNFGPCTWDVSGFGSNITANPLTAFNGNRLKGEALMVNSTGMTIGYFGTAQTLDAAQDPFVKESGNPEKLLVGNGFDDGRAICINGKTNTPGIYRVGGWKRVDGGFVHAMLWKKLNGSWIEESIYDPDGVLASRATWIADINDNGVCVGRIETYAPNIQSGESIDVNEPGGLFIYDPSDKVRRINLPGLTAAAPVRINNNNEIIVNRTDGGTLMPYIVVPPQTSGPVRGSVVDARALFSPDSLMIPRAFYDFRDDRRVCGYGNLNQANNLRVALVTKTSTAYSFLTVTNEAPPNNSAIEGLTVSAGDEASLASLDGDCMDLTFNGSGTHQVTLHGTATGSTTGYNFSPSIRAMTSGIYKVTVSHWDWQDSHWEDTAQDIPLSQDFLTGSLAGSNNSQYYFHNGQVNVHLRLTFTATMTSATPSVQIERAGIARKV